MFYGVRKHFHFIVEHISYLQYYFGDANLARDKFLNEEIKKDNGWVTLVTLLTFNRLKSLSEDPAVIMTALRKSSDDLLEVNISVHDVIFGNFISFTE